MPFIRGRYHINAIAGEALEAAREAEAALRALEQSAQDHEAAQESGDADDDGGAQNGAHNSADKGASGPIRRVEIEAAQMVPAHSGRAERGIVARVHRDAGAGNPAANAGGGLGRAGASPETHVFSSHGDMLKFLHDEFAKDARRPARGPSRSVLA